MGIKGLWPFLARNGYHPEPLPSVPSVAATAPTPILRVDVAGAFYPSVRRAYNRRKGPNAHQALETAITSAGVTKTCVLYVDGAPPIEKKLTHDVRDARRTQALERAEVHLDLLKARIQGQKRVKRYHYSRVEKDLAKGFHWSTTERKGFATHMRTNGWTIQECPFESDVTIASECQGNDIVMSGDSDFLAYDTVSTIYRPVRKGFLRYDVSQVLLCLEISRDQLSALCVVSENDYTKNITTLGPVTNHTLIKSLAGPDAPTIVKTYLGLDEVKRKNTNNASFDTAQRVFFNRLQRADPAPSQSLELYLELAEKLEETRELHRTTALSAVGPPRQGAVANGFMTVDKQHEVQPPPHSSGQKYKFRPRYSAKTRYRMTQHDPPETMELYKFRPWTEPPRVEGGIPPTSTSRPAKAKKSKSAKKDAGTMKKQGLLYTMGLEHPIVTLQVGTLKTNLAEAIDGAQLNNTPIQPLVEKALQDMVQAASGIRRVCERAIAVYLSKLTIDDINAEDRDVLDKLCPRVSNTEDPDNDMDDQESIDDAQGTTNGRFFLSLLTCVYNRRLPRSGASATEINHFIEQVKDIVPSMRGSAIVQSQMPYTATNLLGSTATDMAVSMSVHFRKGSLVLSKQIEGLVKKKVLPASTSFAIQSDIPAAENFLRLNRVLGNRRRLSPISSMEDKFICLSELDLVTLLWRDNTLRAFFREVICGDEGSNHSLQIVLAELATKNTGIVLNSIITDIGTGAGQRTRNKHRSYKRNVKAMTLEEVKEHLTEIRADEFSAIDYTKRGYTLHGSIRTDGFLLQVLAFKLKELKSAKYKRLDEDKIPSRINSTVGGTDYPLSEIRNVVKSGEDVDELWGDGTAPEEIAILGIDLGQAFTVGASVLLPKSGRYDAEKEKEKRKRWKKKKRRKARRRRWRSEEAEEEEAEEGEAEEEEAEEEEAEKGQEPLPVKVLSMAAKQKALYQPIFKHRRWSEARKQETPTVGQSISEIESQLPHLRGKDINIEGYVTNIQAAESQLHSFYNKDQKKVWKRRSWDRKKASQEEFRHLADQLLRMVGGSTAAKRDDNNKVVIAIGLGEFGSNIRLASLHTSFRSYFVQKARSLGYIVVGVNEYYTSRKCPVCEDFVGRVNIRRLYCPKCKAYIHRDILAGHNIANVVRGHLVNQQRPLYLQPRDSQGKYPWMEMTSSSSAMASSSSQGQAQGSGSRKRRR